MDIESAYAEFARSNETPKAKRAAYYEGVLQAFLKNFPGTLLEAAAPFKVPSAQFDLVQKFTVQDCAFFIACERSSNSVGLLYQKATMAEPWFLTMGLGVHTDKTEILQMIHEALGRPL